MVSIHVRQSDNISMLSFKCGTILNMYRPSFSSRIHTRAAKHIDETKKNPGDPHTNDSFLNDIIQVALPSSVISSRNHRIYIMLLQRTRTEG